jgi:tetratricopeptide (TPR) repeat protein
MNSQPRYKKGDKIGGRFLVHQALMGGMGEVYLSLDLELNQPVAIKTFQQDILNNIRFQHNFQQEVAVWVALEKHPNIVRCYYMEFFDNRPFMVLDWVVGDENRGTDLRGWLRYGPLQTRLALDFAIDICRGLVHAEQKIPGIVHRDLKPENILVEQSRIARITDWGLAKIFHNTEFKPSAGIHSSNQGGTPLYMAPEQWQGESLDARTDIYAIGCILFEMLAGHCPFKANTIEKLRFLHLHEAIPPLPQQAHLADINKIIAICLSKQPNQRFTTSSDLLQQLLNIYETRYSESPRELMIQSGEEFTATDYNNRAITYHSLQHYDEALQDCNQALQLDPSLVIAYVNRGSIFRSCKEYNKALQDFDHAIQLDPTWAYPFGNRGMMYHELCQYDKALADYGQAIRLDPNLPQVYCNRGVTYESQQRFNEALADYNNAIQLNPDFAEAYVNRSAFFGGMNRFKEALADANQAIQLNPLLPKAYMNRASANLNLGHVREAFSDIDRAIEQDSNDPVLYYNRAKFNELLQHYNESLVDYDRAIRLDPGYSQAYNNRGLVHSLLRLNEQALDDFTQAIKTDPNHILAYTNRGTMYLQMGRNQEAIADFNTVIQKDPKNLTALVNRGAVYYQTDKLDLALSDFQQAVQIDPNNSIIHRNIGLVHYDSGFLQQALPHFETAYRLGDSESKKYIERIKRNPEKGKTTMSNLERLIQRLKTDKNFLETFRSDPVNAIGKFNLTINEALEFVASEDFPSESMRDMQARLKILELIAKQ